jgi:hypothetical protein
MAEPGFKVAAEHLINFAHAFTHAGGRYDEHVKGLPKFEGSDLIPMMGMPLLGLGFASDHNSVLDTISTAFSEMKRVTEDTGAKLVTTANTYVAAEQKSKQAAQNARHP